ncbi:F-box protein CPR1-like isoform X2 [Cornus florida]|uniref:F-box protein CPR1-like isoform X2 n=1 Tax=Cornus florida TaxID=4283 RepID=UPI0028A14090|nr:F-box protein CPR1-like isoform X2 [Cornus florida]
MSGYFSFIPGDVLSDILTRLPLKTLIRCTSVCKPWHTLLTNPSFITKHLNQSRFNNKELLLVRIHSDSDDKEHYALRYDDNHLFSEYAQLEFPLKSSSCNHYFRIIGCCNGLICLSDDQFSYTNNLFLWNPFIRKTMRLPPVRVTVQTHGLFKHSIGFGFDSITDDYKVVRIVHLENHKKPPEIDIFSLSTGTWRDISHVALPHTIIDERAPQAFLKGAAHWIASSSDAKLIVSFHMGCEEFGQIMLPHNIMAHANQLQILGFRVAKFQDSLALIHLTGAKDKPCCIWVMKEYGVAESWTKQFNIDMIGPFNSVAGFTRNGQLVLASSAGYLLARDPHAGSLMHFLIRGSTHPTYRHSFYADAYSNSLVLLGMRFCDAGTSEESSPGDRSVEGSREAMKTKKRESV